MKQLYHKNKKMKQKICAINLNVIKKSKFVLNSFQFYDKFYLYFFLFFNNDTHFQGVLLAIYMQMYAAIFLFRKKCVIYNNKFKCQLMGLG